MCKDRIKQIVGKWYPVDSDAYFDKCSDVEMWLDNFRKSEIKYAIRILENIEYISDYKIRKIISYISQEIIHVFEGNFKNVFFFPLGEYTSSSGNNFMGDLQKKLKLDNSKFPQESFKSFLNKGKDIVFVDDIIGSGNQAVRFYNKCLRGTESNCYYFSLFGMIEGIENIKKNTDFKFVVSFKKLTDEDMAFSDTSQIFTNMEEREKIKNFCQEYGKDLYDNPLGYNNSQLLIVFPYNTPNNTLPIIWASPDSEKKKGTIWRPLFPRIKITKRDDKKNNDNHIVENEKICLKSRSLKNVIKNFVFVKGGTFYIRPDCLVTLDDYKICKYQVSQKLWIEVMGTLPKMVEHKGSTLPITYVSWLDCIVFCNKISKLNGLEECYRIIDKTVELIPKRYGYRLPTEAEWIYAARGGNRTERYLYAGDNDIDNVAWYFSNSESKVHPIGCKLSNGLDLYDMSGNVWEWCWELFEDYPSNSEDNLNLNFRREEHVVKGGGFVSNLNRCMIDYRNSSNFNQGLLDVGFRLVLSTT